MNSAPGEFLDGNVLVYAFTSDPRAETAQRLLARGCSISVQGLNEFTSVAQRKLGMSWAELREALVVAAALGADCRVLWSEDMHDGLLIDRLIDRRLRISNPFRQRQGAPSPQ